MATIPYSIENYAANIVWVYDPEKKRCYGSIGEKTYRIYSSFNIIHFPLLGRPLTREESEERSKLVNYELKEEVFIIQHKVRWKHFKRAMKETHGIDLKECSHADCPSTWPKTYEEQKAAGWFDDDEEVEA
jgi:hypothetical protein